MHENYNYVENREQQNENSQTTIDTRYILGYPFGRKPNWKVRLFYSLSLPRNFMQVQKSEACALKGSIVHKSVIYALSLSLLAALLIYGTKMHSNRIGTPLPPCGSIITQLNSLLVVKFESFNS